MNLDDYRCPDEIFYLLRQWGRATFHGMPRLGYPAKAAACGDYLPRRSKDLEPKRDLADFDRLCAIIDHTLNRPKVEALKCRFRYHEDGRYWNKRRSARHMGLTVPEYETLLRQAMRTVHLNMSEAER